MALLPELVALYKHVILILLRVGESVNADSLSKVIVLPSIFETDCVNYPFSVQLLFEHRSESAPIKLASSLVILLIRGLLLVELE